MDLRNDTIDCPSNNSLVTRDQMSYNSSQDAVGAQLADVVRFMDTGRKPQFLCGREDALAAVQCAETAKTLYEEKRSALVQGR